MFRLVILLATLVLCCDSFELPSYFTKCTCDDTLKQCFLDNAVAIKPHLKDGVEKFAIPKLVPYHIDSLVLETGKDLTFKLTDVDIFDLDTFEMPTMVADMPGHYIAVTMSFDVIHITGMYEVDGKILVLPIKGHGPIAITVEKVNCTYGFNFDFHVRDDVKYFRFSTAAFDFQFVKMGLRLDNLFNGDKTLGDQVNAFLNENSEEIGEFLKDPLANIVKRVIYDVVYEFGETLPAEEMCILPDSSIY